MESLFQFCSDVRLNFGYSTPASGGMQYLPENDPDHNMLTLAE